MVLDWFVRYVPGWIGPTAVFLGLLVASIGLLWQGSTRLVSKLDSMRRFLALSVVGIVFIWAVANLLKMPGFLVRYPVTYAVLFTFGAKWIEGAGGITLLRKVSYYAREQNWPRVVTLQEKAFYKLSLFFLGIVGSYAAIGVLIYGPVSLPISGPLLVVWTVTSFLASVVGLSWKVAAVSEYLPTLLLYGTLLMLGGVEVFNVTSLTGEIQVFVAGGVGYSMGYLSVLVLRFAR